MSFNWSEYLNLAEMLTGRTTIPSSQEAKLRSAVSRAYYAAFCQARNHLRDEEGHTIPPGGQAHPYVRDALRSSSDRARKQIGNDLDRLRRRRNQADYEDVFPALPAEADTALRLAAKVIFILSNL